MVGLAIYSVKQFGRWRAARKMRRLARQAADAAAAAAGEDQTVQGAPTSPQTAF